MVPKRVKIKMPAPIIKFDKVKETHCLSPSIIMMGSPVSGSTLKNRYFKDHKNKSNLRIEDLGGLRQGVKNIKSKSCEEKELKRSESDRMPTQIKFKKKTNNLHLKSSKNPMPHCRNNRLEALKII